MGTLSPLYRKAPGGQSLGHGAQRQSQGAREAQARRKRKIKGGDPGGATTARRTYCDSRAGRGRSIPARSARRQRKNSRQTSRYSRRPIRAEHAETPRPQHVPGPTSRLCQSEGRAPPHPKALEKMQPGICENRAGVHALQLVADGPRPLETLNPYLVFLPTRPPCKFSARARPRVGEGRSHCRKAT